MLSALTGRTLSRSIVADGDQAAEYPDDDDGELLRVVLLWRTIDPGPIAERVPDAVRRRTATLMLARAELTFLVWSLPLLAAAVSGDAPKWLDNSSTMVTDALDLAIITPSALLAGMLLRRSEPLGYLIVIVLLVLLLVLAPAITAQTVSQLAVDIDFTPAEVIGPMAGFVVLGALAAWCLIGLLRPLASGAGRSA